MFFNLTDCTEIRTGYPFRGAITEVRGGDVGVIQMKDIDSGGGVEWSGVLRTELEGRRRPDWIEDDDVLFVARGPRFYAARATDPPCRAVCSPHLFHLRVKSRATLLPAFLVWQLNQTPIQREIQAAAEGSNQLSIRRAEMGALTICVPPLEAQQRIVALADTARRERALLHAMIANREKQLEAIALTLARIEGAPAYAIHETP